MRETVWMIMQKAFSFYEVHSNFTHFGNKFYNLYWKEYAPIETLEYNTKRIMEDGRRL